MYFCEFGIWVLLKTWFYLLVDADSALFDAAQYAFFGKALLDEVEIGGLEDGENGAGAGLGGGFRREDELNEYHLFGKDNVCDYYCGLIYVLRNLVLLFSAFGILGFFVLGCGGGLHE